MKVEWYHIFLLALLIVTGIICNTTDDGGILGDKRVEWKFMDDLCTISAREVGNISKGEMIYKDIKIDLKDQTMFENEQLMMFTNFGLLPIVRSIKRDNIEILLGIKAPEIDKIHRLIINEKQIIISDTLPLLKGVHDDVDKDGIVEFSGFMNNFESYCSNCDSIYYNPLLYYEMTKNGFTFDSLATTNWINKHYSNNFGFKADKSKIVRLKNPTEI